MQQLHKQKIKKGPFFVDSLNLILLREIKRERDQERERPRGREIKRERDQMGERSRGRDIKRERDQMGERSRRRETKRERDQEREIKREIKRSRERSRDQERERDQEGEIKRDIKRERERGGGEAIQVVRNLNYKEFYAFDKLVFHLHPLKEFQNHKDSFVGYGTHRLLMFVILSLECFVQNIH